MGICMHACMYMYMYMNMYKYVYVFYQLLLSIAHSLIPFGVFLYVCIYTVQVRLIDFIVLDD